MITNHFSILATSRRRTIRVLVLHRGRIKAGHGELDRKGVDLGREDLDVVIVFQVGQKDLHTGATLLLQLDGNQHGLVQKVTNRFKVGFDHLSRCQGRTADAHTSGRNGRRIARDTVLVQGNRYGVADLFKLAPGQTLRLEIP
jgi:hypothetical protein